MSSNCNIENLARLSGTANECGNRSVVILQQKLRQSPMAGNLAGTAFFRNLRPKRCADLAKIMQSNQKNDSGALQGG